MKSLAKYHVFWKIFSTIAIPVAVFFMVITGKLLFDNLMKIAAGVGAAGVGILIPGVKIPGSPFFVPFWPGIIAIAVLAVVHEFGHGIVAAMEGIKLKATGFGFLAILPLAFVELDEKQMEKMEPLARLRVFAAGPFANIALWLLLSVILSFTFVPFTSNIIVNDGLNISVVEQGMPAELAGLQVGDVITSINNKSVLEVKNFLSAFEGVETGDVITIETTKGIYEVKTTTHPSDNSKPYVGITVVQASHISETAKEKYGFGLDVILWFFEVFKWIALLNFLVGIMNFLPIWTLDGGRIAYDLFGYVIKNQKILFSLLNIIFAFYLTLIILNLIGPAIFPLIF